MTDYRAYLIAPGGHIKAAQEFVAQSDVAAEALCKGWAGGKPVELWNRGRLVAQFNQVELKMNNMMRRGA